MPLPSGGVVFSFCDVCLPATYPQNFSHASLPFPGCFSHLSFPMVLHTEGRRKLVLGWVEVVGDGVGQAG